MNPNANFFKLGLFVILSFFLGALFLIVFGAGDFFKKELLAETCFNESVQGLSIGSEVKYKGIQIGTVKDITSAAKVYGTKSDYVLVIISLEDDISLGQTGKSAKERIKNAIRDGLSVKLTFKGLTGAAYLETDYQPQDPVKQLKLAWQPKNLYIPSRQSSIKQYGDLLNQILDNLAAINLKGITQDIEVLLKTLDQKANDFDMARISNLTASLVSELKATNQKVSQTLDSEKMKKLMSDAQSSFSNINRIVESARPELAGAFRDFRAAAQSTKRITSGLEERLSPKVDTLSTNLDKLVKSLAATSGMLENIVWLNSDRIRTIIENLETTSENLKQMSKDIKQYPGQLLYQKAPEKFDSKKGER